MKFAEKIIYIRNRENLSKLAFAKLIGINRNTVTNWESEVTKPTVDNLIKLSLRFHVTLDCLLDDNKGIELSLKGFSEIQCKLIKDFVTYYEQQNELRSNYEK